MSEKEYLDRVELIKFVMAYTPNIHGDTTMKSVKRAINAAPIASDVVEVVRCEKCICAESITDVDGNSGLYCHLRNCKYVNPDDFCSWGERKVQT